MIRVATKLEVGVKASFATFQKTLQTSGSEKFISKLGSHFPGAGLSWEALLKSIQTEPSDRLSDSTLKLSFQFFKELTKELTNSPAMSGSLLSPEIVLILTYTLTFGVDHWNSHLQLSDLSAFQRLVKSLSKWEDEIYASVFLLKYCVVRDPSVLMLSSEVIETVLKVLSVLLEIVPWIENMRSGVGTERLMKVLLALLTLCNHFAILLRKHRNRDRIRPSTEITLLMKALDERFQRTPLLREIAEEQYESYQRSMDQSDVDSLCSSPAISFRFVLLSYLSLEPDLEDYVCREVTLELQKVYTDNEGLILNYFLLRQKVSPDLDQSGPIPVCTSFLTFIKEAQIDPGKTFPTLLPGYVSIQEFHPLWTSFRRRIKSVSDLYFLLSLLDFLGDSSVAVLKVDGCGLIRDIVCSSPNVRFRASQCGVVSHAVKNQCFELVEQLCYVATYPSELQAILTHLNHILRTEGPSSIAGNTIDLVAKVCRVAAEMQIRSPFLGYSGREEETYIYRYSNTISRDWNIAATVYVPSILDSIWSIGGADVFLYVLNFLDESIESQFIRLSTLKIFALTIGSASPDFFEFLGFRLEETSPKCSWTEEETIELLEIIAKAHSDPIHATTIENCILLNHLIWSNLSDEVYYQHIFPALHTIVTRRDEAISLNLELYDELWTRRSYIKLWDKVKEVMEYIHSAALEGNVGDLLRSLCSYLAVNLHESLERLRPVTELVLLLIENEVKDGLTHGRAVDLVMQLLYLTDTQCEPGVVYLFLKILITLHKKKRGIPQTPGSILTKKLCFAVMKKVVNEVDVEMYQLLLHFSAGVSGNATLRFENMLLEGGWHPGEKWWRGISNIIELLPRCTLESAVQIWSDFVTLIWRLPTEMSDLSCFPSAFIDILGNFLKLGLMQENLTSVCISFAKLLTCRLPLVDNIPKIRNFTYCLLSQRCIWGVFGAIVEQVAALVLEPVTEDATRFVRELVVVIEEVAVYKNAILQFDFRAVLRAINSYITSPIFYENDNPLPELSYEEMGEDHIVSVNAGGRRRAVLNTLLIAIKESTEIQDLDDCLMALEDVLDAMKVENYDGFFETWGFIELTALACGSAGPKQDALLKCILSFYAHFGLIQKLKVNFQESETSFRVYLQVLRKEIDSIIKENAGYLDRTDAFLLSEETEQDEEMWQERCEKRDQLLNALQVTKEKVTLLHLLQSRDWKRLIHFHLKVNIVLRLSGIKHDTESIVRKSNLDSRKSRTFSIWKKPSVSLDRLRQTERTDRTQRLFLKSKWKRELKKWKGLYGVWETGTGFEYWKIANFTTAQGRRNRLVRKRCIVARSSSVRKSRSTVMKAEFQASVRLIVSSEPTTPNVLSLERPSLDSIDQVEYEQFDLQEPEQELSISCERIMPQGCVYGKLMMTHDFLYFLTSPRKDPTEPDAFLALVICRQEHTRLDVEMERIWQWREIGEIWERRFLHKHIAFELFLTSGRSYFFNCFTTISRDIALNWLFRFSMTPAIRLKSGKRSQLKKIKEMWLQGELSNFEYLFRLNQFGSRSYNDPGQYPVFPWVLQSYLSPELGLDSPDVYRDFQYSVGAQSEIARNAIMNHYEMMRTTGMEPFHFGSHYSTCGMVSYYLIRLEPFTSLAMELQDGRFDVADRLFADVAASWKNCLNSSGDYKELIPEFFSLPEMFCNMNEYDFGKTQEGVHVSHVTLPKWSSSGAEQLKSAYYFVYLHSKALESAYTSTQLSKWVDLIFGFKQHGTDAFEASNVFFPYTYEDKFLKAYRKASEAEKDSMKHQVAYYGQTPMQLFPSSPHPSRDCVPIRQSTTLKLVSKELFLYEPSQSKTVAIYLFKGKLICVGDNRMLRIFNLGTRQLDIVSLESDPISVPAPYKSQHFAVSNEILITGYYSGCSFKVHNLETGRLLQEVNYHVFPVTCLYCEKKGLLAGSEDCTVSVWQLITDKGSTSVSSTPLGILFGHRTPLVRCLLDTGSDNAISIDQGGVILVHSFASHQVLAVISTPANPSLNFAFSPKLQILAVYNRTSEHIDLYTVAGSRVDTLALQSGDLVDVLMFNEDGDCLYTGGSKTISSFYVFSDKLGGKVLLKVERTVRSLCQDGEALFVATQANEVSIIETEEEVNKKKVLEANLKQVGFWPS